MKQKIISLLLILALISTPMLSQVGHAANEFLIGDTIYYNDGLKVAFEEINIDTYRLTAIDEYTGDTASEVIHLKNSLNSKIFSTEKELILELENLLNDSNIILPNDKGLPGEPPGSGTRWRTQYIAAESSHSVSRNRATAIVELTSFVIGCLILKPVPAAVASSIADSIVNYCMSNNTTEVFYITYYQAELDDYGVATGKTREICLVYADPGYKYFIKSVLRYSDSNQVYY